MITLNFDAAAETLKLATTTTLLTGLDYRLQVIFAAAPADLTSPQIGLYPPEAPANTLAYTEDFNTENAATQSALLDTNDSRLTGYMLTRTTASLVLQFSCLIDGERRGARTTITVQPGGLLGPQSSPGGPVYFTATEVIAYVATAVAAQAASNLPSGKLVILPGVVGVTGGGATKLDGTPTIGQGYNVVALVDSAEGLVGYQRIASTDATAAPGFVRAADYDADTNAFGWKKVF